MTNETFAAAFSRNDIADRIADLLAELGDTADAVADRLTQAGVTGKRSDAHCCPIANYLRANEPCIDLVDVLGDVIDVYTVTGATASVAAPDAIEAFVSMFDTERYPHLIARRGTR